MTVISAETEAILASASAIVRCLPSGISVGEAIEGQAGIADAIPDEDSKAITASLSGNLHGTIVLILAPEIAEVVENGPIGPQNLVAGLETALTDAASALSQTFGIVRCEAPLSVEANIALSNVSSFEVITTVPLLGAIGSSGTLVVMMDKPTVVPKRSNEQDATFETLSSTIAGSAAARAMELLNDVEMGVTAELGRTRMTVRELLSLQPGSVVELDRAAGSPVDLLVNGTLVARGEVVVVDEEFGVRITEIIGYDIKKTGQ